MLEEEIRAKAIEFAKRNRILIAKELTNVIKYIPDKYPISVFMAGSPGAGKTEFSKNLIDILGKNKDNKIIRIDGDDMRHLLPGYVGVNSYLFQYPISLILEKIHDLALSQKQSFVFDGTFSNYKKAKDNIQRSLDKKRIVFIFYIYQKPEVAWKFTKARENAEGRNIPKSAFVEQFLGARETIKKVLKDFNEDVTIFIVKKDFEKNIVERITKIISSKNDDEQLERGYTKEELQQCL